eukprot:CAMPEP_0115726646 /NCGR_PEP_ID=MMETSP0272-20121206/81993_1 /TAXON_ID=71861 /ORGANISM="Scrippsiella trochoidea, Strain CCMP3099" /LENGTH=481 /DNA_ID=CAMNT_0003170091 /DNA_START=201 /DNA_END=1644 /DNA_ORIENTATION=+
MQTKGRRDFTIEAIDMDHSEIVQALTEIVMNVSVVVGMVFALVHSGIGNDYFKGANTCPSLSIGRQALARFDVNMFYYYKASLATYCDIEDSFWRLLLDGWLRGVVSGSDSYPLLLSTLPKAWLFKSAISTLLRPVYAVLYATCGLAMQHIFFMAKDAVEHVHTAIYGNDTSSGKVSNFLKRIWRFPGRLKASMTAESPWLNNARILLMSVSTALRLGVNALGFHHLAGLGGEEVSLWQLMCEPTLFYWLSHQFAWMDAKLRNTIWKKGPPSANMPLTRWREKPSKNVVELMQYATGRIRRTLDYYKQQAEAILSILVDDIFNISEATGFHETDVGGKYLTDQLLRFGFSHAVLGVSPVGRVLRSYVLFTDASEFIRWVKHLLWRLFFPYVFYLLNSKWNAYLESQEEEFKNEWKGRQTWKDGQYADMLESTAAFGTESIVGVAAAAVKKKKVPVEVEAAGDLNGASELAGERATDLVGRS